MMEVYLLVAMYGLGYMMTRLNKKQQQTASTVTPKVPLGELPSTTNVYEAKRVPQVAQTEQRAAAQMLKRPAQNVFQPHQTTSVYSHLAGVEMPQQQFKHNNMQPFYRGESKPIGNFETFVERNTGNSPYYKNKQEISPLFDPSQNAADLAVHTDLWKDRIVQPILQNNVLPVEQIRVGPGVGRGYTAEPTGGYQQFDARDYAMPKTVDETRVLSKPKVTYDARVVDGQKGKVLGEIGEVAKNRASNFKEWTDKDMLPTTGAYLKPISKPTVEVKDTQRQSTTTEYMGHLHDQNTRAPQTRPDVREPNKPQLEGYDMGHAHNTRVGKGESFDHGKSTILVYGNARDVTGVETYTGNVTSLVKALVAPFEDLMRVTKKEEIAELPMDRANVKAQIPAKMTVYDPSDVARSTLKETLIENDHVAPLKGPLKITVFDRNDLMRTTGRETISTDTPLQNVKGPVKSVVYDPNDIMRTTNKETLLTDAQLMNVRPLNVRERQYNTDDKENRRKTVRETLEETDTMANVNGGRKAQEARIPGDRTKTTHKETTLVEDFGNVDGVQDRNMGYLTNPKEAKTTQKELFSDNAFMGHLERQGADAYKVIDVEAKDTQRQYLSDHDYYGGAESKNKAMMSYEDIYNATLNELREDTLVRPDRTATGPKVAVGADTVHIDIKKQHYERSPQEASPAVTYLQEAGPTDLGQETRGKQNYMDPGRLDTHILDALHSNPYALPSLSH